MVHIRAWMIYTIGDQFNGGSLNRKEGACFGCCHVLKPPALLYQGGFMFGRKKNKNKKKTQKKKKKSNLRRYLDHTSRVQKYDEILYGPKKKNKKKKKKQ